MAKAKTDKKVPLSEDERKFHRDWSAEDCLTHLRGIAEAHPDQVISRNFFRVHSDISEATWNRYFGTFQEFKRQAGIVLSRHAHRLERSIAKHASVDVLRKLNETKRNYEGAYSKPNRKRWKTILNGSDVHDVDCDPFWRRMFLEAAGRIQPDVIVLNGDTFDLPEFGKYTQDPRTWDVVGRIRWVHQFLHDLRETCPDAEIVMVEGNHEFRLLRHMAEATPALMTVLADLHGFTVPKLLGLDEYEVNYVARMDLAAWTERDIKEELRRNYTIQYDAVLFHHFPEGARMGYPGTNGHHHKHVVTPYYSPLFGSYEWHQTGSGHARSASYTPGEKWSNGFLVIHVDALTRHSVFEYVDVRDFAVLGGVFYTRHKSEVVHPED